MPASYVISCAPGLLWLVSDPGVAGSGTNTPTQMEAELNGYGSSKLPATLGCWVRRLLHAQGRRVPKELVVARPGPGPPQPALHFARYDYKTLRILERILYRPSCLQNHELHGCLRQGRTASEFPKKKKNMHGCGMPHCIQVLGSRDAHDLNSGLTLAPQRI